MRIWVCGVRGSTPAPGPEYVRYGGHTSCLAIAHDGGRPTLILDAGTGIRRISDLFDAEPGIMAGEAMDGAILLGHLHWDHTQGLPFFAAGNNENSRVDLYAPEQGDIEEVLAGFMSPPYFPITPGELLGSWTFTGLSEGRYEIEGFRVLALDIPHSGGRTLGFRISDGTSTIAYLSDHCPTKFGPGPDGLGEYHDAAVTLARDCDLLIHDAQYTDDELPERARFGHASCGYAVGLARRAGAREVLLFHHDPAQRDDEIDAIVAMYKDDPVVVSAAAERSIIDLPR